jgi:hypothetical protein
LSTNFFHEKHPDNSVIVTLDEEGRLVFPEGKVFIPDASVRLNIVGHPEKLEKVGAQNLANYTDEIMQRYNIDSVDSHAYLNRSKTGASLSTPNFRRSKTSPIFLELSVVQLGLLFP